METLFPSPHQTELQEQKTPFLPTKDLYNFAVKSSKAKDRLELVFKVQ